MSGTIDSEIDLTSSPGSNDSSSDFVSTTSPVQKVKTFDAGNVGSAIKNNIKHRQSKTLQKLTAKLTASVKKKSSAKVVKKKCKKNKHKQKSTYSQHKKKLKLSPCKKNIHRHKVVLPHL